MKVAIHQPNYVPWLGFFTKIRHSDVFVFLDDTEVSNGQSYVYRSQVRKDQGPPTWLSVPILRQPGQAIESVRFAETTWARTHLNKLAAYYRKTGHWAEISTLIEQIYAEPGELLAEFNIRMIEAIARALMLRCRFERSSSLKPDGVRDRRLIDLVKKVGGTTYLSGKGGQNYQDPERFASAGLGLEVREYTPIPYPQHHGEFIGGLSILDALFNLGLDRVPELLRYPQASGNQMPRENSTSHTCQRRPTDGPSRNPGECPDYAS